MTIAVLGAGMVGRAIALDLATEYKVTSFDINAASLQHIKNENPSVNIKRADLSLFEEYKNWFKDFDLVITAVPGSLGFKTLEAVINTGKNVVDISFFPEDSLLLHELAKSKGSTVITDCGVAPGMSNLILGRYNEEMEIKEFACYVGGLPKEKKQPFQYKAPFSPVDVIQEYIRPARLVENGQLVVKPALTDRELIRFDEIGELEAFNTDGLRSLVHTMKHIPDMKEKTLRYPGHIDLIIALKQAGFFGEEPVQIGGTSITPLQFTSELLINEWKLEPGEEEFTVMKVIIKGPEQIIEYNLLDRYDQRSKTSSMARTTGYTCTAAANLVLKDIFSGKGVFPPEILGKDSKCFEFILEYLKQRNVNWNWKRAEIKK